MALKSDLTEAEAQDAVQETVITMAKNLKVFKTDPAHGSFKAWLLKTAQWRILNQFKKRRPDQVARAHRAPKDTRQTATVDRLPDSRETDLESVWNAEWKDHLISVALERLKKKVKPKQFQILFLHTIRGQSARQVADSLGINITQVYLVKHRVTPQFKAEIERLEREMEGPGFTFDSVGIRG